METMWLMRGAQPVRTGHVAGYGPLEDVRLLQRRVERNRARSEIDLAEEADFDDTSADHASADVPIAPG